ncbi:hypothetical protein [Nonomuraea basaltis]|uniref:hypothetical protein n=1 Tax=Nonomuraea basaltis TaxID=2495887 RepID=UPI00110C4A4A|nr:hypothetical protein [Nonomuraea basaltis]TMR89527.1 hypothetical protein EJK15_60325 [Nonomuraea basaltis]
MTSMLEILGAGGPDPEHVEELMLYGRLVGDWSIRNRYRTADGDWRTVQERWCFGWVLGGLAVQDVLYSPDAGPRGTTIRCYDRTAKVWHITWQDPRHGVYVSQIGRPDGDGMLQEGTAADGTRARWAFSDVTGTSFVWRGWIAAPGGEFEFEQEMHATRG